jgi:hypothetical protein
MIILIFIERPAGVALDAGAVLKNLTDAGLKTFTPEEAKTFIDFRLALSDGVGDFFYYSFRL